ANITARAIIGGFAQPGQGEVLAPFRDRYFEAISGVWERRSSESLLISQDGYSPMTTVCATSLERRSHTPEMASKYLSRNGA
ncbi:hypothetical protein C6A85_12370, partial [Mycobacterium sp. ITM-2017-0098]